jgi:hypothetical protein
VIETDFSTLLVVILFAMILAYRVTLFHRKTIGYFSLLQIIYLVVVPGFLFPLAYSYLQSILARPVSDQAVLPDGLMVNVILLATLFTYGGVAIHAVTKMLSEVLRHEESEASRINKYFHLTFSHNLTFAGVLLTVLGFALLELNRVPVGDPQNLITALAKGLGLGVSLIMAMYLYTRSVDEYSGKWSDLNGVFFVLWLGLMLVLYGIRKVDPTLSDYQLLLPALLGLSMVAGLNIILVLRRLKNGGVKILVRWNRIRRLLGWPEQ